MKRMRAKVCTVLTLLFFLSSTAWADIVYMKNGQQFSGQIVNQTRTSITIRTPQGMRTLQKADMRTIQFGVTAEEKARQEARRQEMIRRQKALEAAKAKQQATEAEAERKRLEQLRQQEEQEKEELKERQKQVLSAEEQLAKLNSEEEDLEKRLAEIRQKRAQLEGNEGAPIDYLWRSAVLPGWGQIHAGDTWKGYGIMGLTILTGSYAAIRYSDSLTLQSGYDSSRNLWNGYLLGSGGNSAALLGRLYVPQSDLSALQSAQSDAATFGIITGVLYLYNLFDAYFLTGPNSLLSEAPEGKPAYRLISDNRGDQFRMGIQMHF